MNLKSRQKRNNAFSHPCISQERRVTVIHLKPSKKPIEPDISVLRVMPRSGASAYVYVSNKEQCSQLPANSKSTMNVDFFRDISEEAGIVERLRKSKGMHTKKRVHFP